MRERFFLATSPRFDLGLSWPEARTITTRLLRLVSLVEVKTHSEQKKGPIFLITLYLHLYQAWGTIKQTQGHVGNIPL